MKKVSVIVPVYYNEGSLPHLFRKLEEIETSLLQKDMRLELIFVDDGSQDASLVLLLEFKKQRPSTIVIKLTRNFGAVHASKAGLRFVTGDCFTILAADLQDPPELILEMVQCWNKGVKFVVCVRSNRDDPLLTRLFSQIYYSLLRLYVVKDYPKGGFDVALMDKAFLPFLRESSKNTFTPLLAYWLGFKPVALTYNRRKRIHGSSRWTFAKRLKASIDALMGFSVVPIRLISLAGLVVAVLSFLYGGWITINALFGFTDVKGFATLVCLVAFLQGIGLFMSGVLGEYLWRIFDETNKRPEVVIDEVYRD